jgi:hypothetical protein
MPGTQGAWSRWRPEGVALTALMGRLMFRFERRKPAEEVR